MIYLALRRTGLEPETARTFDYHEWDRLQTWYITLNRGIGNLLQVDLK